MGPRRLIVLLVALATAGGTALYARSWVQGQRAPAAAPGPEVVVVKEDLREVLVAAENLPAGTFVAPKAVRWQRWPSGDLPETYFVRDQRGLDAVTGAVVRRGIAKGEPLTDGAVVLPGDRGFLAAVLEPGMRAVSVPINEASGNAGLIFPGDRVDLILTQTLADGSGEGQRMVSETALESIRVIAIGRRLNDDPAMPDANQGRTATLEVTPKQAEVVALVTELGKLSLSLRSLARPEEVAALEAPQPGAQEEAEERVTWDREASLARRAARQGDSQRLLVVRGGEKTEMSVPGGRP